MVNKIIDNILKIIKLLKRYSLFKKIFKKKIKNNIVNDGKKLYELNEVNEPIKGGHRKQVKHKG